MTFLSFVLFLNPAIYSKVTCKRAFRRFNILYFMTGTPLCFQQLQGKLQKSIHLFFLIMVMVSVDPEPILGMLGMRWQHGLHRIA